MEVITMYYHGTNETSYNSIIENGFKFNPNKYNRFGNGIYFSDNNDTEYYGEYTIQVELINFNPLIMTIDEYNNSLCNYLIGKYGNDYMLHMHNYFLENGYNGLIIQFHNSNEVIVYDTNIINIVDNELKTA